MDSYFIFYSKFSSDYKDLKCVERCVYMLIHSMTFNSRQMKCSGLNYISDYLGCDERTVSKSIKKLEEIGLVSVQKKGPYKQNSYKALVNYKKEGG